MPRIKYESDWCSKYESKNIRSFKVVGMDHVQIAVTAFEGNGTVYVHIVNEKKEKNKKISLSAQEFMAVVRLSSHIRPAIDEAEVYVKERGWDVAAKAQEKLSESRFTFINLANSDSSDVDDEEENVQQKIQVKRKKHQDKEHATMSGQASVKGVKKSSVTKRTVVTTAEDESDGDDEEIEDRQTAKKKLKGEHETSSRELQ